MIEVICYQYMELILCRNDFKNNLHYSLNFKSFVLQSEQQAMPLSVSNPSLCCLSPLFSSGLMSLFQGYECQLSKFYPNKASIQTRSHLFQKMNSVIHQMNHFPVDKGQGEQLHQLWSHYRLLPRQNQFTQGKFIKNLPR